MVPIHWHSIVLSVHFGDGLCNGGRVYISSAGFIYQVLVLTLKSNFLVDLNHLKDHYQNGEEKGQGSPRHFHEPQLFYFPSDNSQESLLFEEEERSTQSIVSVLSSTPSSQNSKFPSNISPLPDAHPSPMYVFEGFLNLNYLLAVKNVHLLQNQFSL